MVGPHLFNLVFIILQKKKKRCSILIFFNFITHEYVIKIKIRITSLKK